MGTDMHMYIEKKSKDNKWEKVNIPDSLLPEDRNYKLFGLLADVRNGSGFGFCKIGEKLDPLFADRGFPEDHSIPKGNWLGDHSFTYFTLKEILDAELPFSYTHCGYVDREQFEVYKKGLSPNRACGDVFGPSIKKTSDIKEFEKDKSFTHVQIQWNQLKPFDDDYFFVFCREVLPRFTNTWSEEEYQNIRIIIGFDS